MKFLKVFGLFFLLQALAWGATHVYLSQHQPTVLVVVDTSYALRPRFSTMEQWLNNFQANTRYKHILIGTDKALLGDLERLPSKSTIFRTAFGRMSVENLQRYADIAAEKKILLSDGSIQAPGWKVITFPPTQ